MGHSYIYPYYYNVLANHGNASMKLFPEHATDDNELHPISLITFRQKKNGNKSIVKRLKIYFEFGPVYNSF